LLSIGALATATGIPAQTLRTWERRYGAPEATRKPSGHRLYPVSLVTQLRKVAQLLERGHRAGEILTLTSSELDPLLALVPTGATMTRRAERVAPASLVPGDHDMSEWVRAVKRLDRDALLGLLRERWTRLGPLEFLQACAGRLMAEVGAAWRAGTLEIRHEHFATACLAGFLREVREPFDRQAQGPLVITATLPRDIHEGGLLMSSVLLAVRGCRVLYLGTDVPMDQIAAAARERGARAVALSVSAAVTSRRASSGVTHLRALLPRSTALWVGGAGVPPPSRGVRCFTTLGALDEMLDSIA
jgi:methanogenic corrinoid protein MtbC1